MSPIEFFAAGDPKGQPRPRAFARKFGAKWQARVYDAGTAEGWKSQIAIAAKAFIPETPIAGPVRVDLRFYMPRPKKHFKTGKHSAVLRDDAPYFVTAKPDRDNMDKAVLDCLTTLGFWNDDSQVVGGSIWKRYVGEVGKTGCQITIEQLIDEPPRRLFIDMSTKQLIT